MSDLEQENSSSTPDWLYFLLKDDENEDVYDEAYIQLLEGDARIFVWTLAKEMVQGDNIGLAGQACCLYERFMALRLKKLPQMEIGSIEWETVKNDIQQRTPLYIGTCIQLVCKMNSNRNCITLSSLRRILLKHDLFYSFKEIFEAELEVYQMLNYRIPTWTNVQKAQILASEVNMKAKVYKSVAYVMDIAEFHRVTVQQHAKTIAWNTAEPGPSTSADFSNRGSVHDIHLAAGAVVAAGEFMQFNGADPVPKLASFTRSPEAYIKCIANVIVEHLLSNKVASKKRRCSSALQWPDHADSSLKRLRILRPKKTSNRKVKK